MLIMNVWIFKRTDQEEEEEEEEEEKEEIIPPPIKSQDSLRI